MWETLLNNKKMKWGCRLVNKKTLYVLPIASYKRLSVGSLLGGDEGQDLGENYSITSHC